MAKIGQRAWFLEEKISESDKKKIKNYDESVKNNELDCIFDVYSSVKAACCVGLLHRKSERLKIKDDISKFFITRIRPCIEYLIDHKDKFPKSKWFDKTNQLVMIDSLQGNTFGGKPPQYREAMCVIVDQYLPTATLKKFYDNDESIDLDAILDENENNVIIAISEIMSAHLYFYYSFPDNWLEPNQLLAEESTNLMLDGRIYQPLDQHCWIVNLSWIMAHLHKGNDFIIFSDLSEDNLVRKTPGHVGELSGFAKEIALAKKLGYEVKLDGNQICMRASSEVKERCQNLAFEDVKMNDEEVRFSYLEVKAKIDELKNKKRSPDEFFEVSLREAKKAKKEEKDKDENKSKSEYEPPPSPSQ